jgi:diacylglycerol O-acyltransferase / wax synthase
MTVIDDALHQYLREHQAPTGRPLVALMPMSLRDESGGGAGNQAIADLIAMGTPQASLGERLSQINRATKKAKEKGRGMQTTSRQAHALLLFASLTMSDILPWFGKVPSANLVISNMKGPTGQLYLAGAPLVAFLGMPILPPGAGLNVTFVSVNNDICLGIGAAPEAVDDPYHLAQLIEKAFRRLQFETAKTAIATARRPAPASVIGTSPKQHRTRKTP